jgi:putative transposase
MTISFARHQFPPAIIRHAVWVYVRLTLSYRDVEDLLAERGLVRRWVLKFGPLFARELRRRRPRPTARWHLDEMALMTRAGSSGFGAQSTTKASSTCWCNDAATRLQP